MVSINYYSFIIGMIFSLQGRVPMVISRIRPQKALDHKTSARFGKNKPIIMVFVLLFISGKSYFVSICCLALEYDNI